MSEAVELGRRSRALHFHDLIRMRMISLLRSRGSEFQSHPRVRAVCAGPDGQPKSVCDGGPLAL